MRKSCIKFRKSSSRKRRSKRMPKKSKRVSRRRVSRRRVSRHRRYRLSSLRDWPRVVAPGVPPPQIKDCGDYTWRAPHPGINKWETGCPSWKLTGYVSPYTRAARISRSNPGRVAAARLDALKNEKLSVERAYSQAISEGLLLPSEIAVLERRFRALEKELDGPPPQPGEVVDRELPVGTGAPWENPKSRARLCKRNHHRNCKCGKRDWIFLPDSSGWTD